MWGKSAPEWKPCWKRCRKRKEGHRDEDLIEMLHGGSPYRLGFEKSTNSGCINLSQICFLGSRSWGLVIPAFLKKAIRKLSWDPSSPFVFPRRGKTHSRLRSRSTSRTDAEAAFGALGSSVPPFSGRIQRARAARGRFSPEETNRG